MSFDTTQPLAKPLTGTYGFPVDTDRTGTLSNLGFGATAAIANVAVARAARTGADAITLTPATSLAIDASQGNLFTLALTANTTISFTNLHQQELVLAITVTGTPTIAWTGITWPAATPPTVPATTHTGVYRIFKIGTVVYGFVQALTY